MLGWIDYTPPSLFDGGSCVLLVLCGTLAFMVSPLSPLHQDSRNRVAPWLPPIVLVSLLLFGVGIRHLEPRTFFVWNTNWGIICAFGLAFSMRLFRSPGFGPSLKIETHTLSHKDWKRHVLGFHKSEHGNFEVEALSAEDNCIHVVLLSHWHTFYEVGTPEDAERRAFHQGLVSSDLGGQREFAWGEVLCRLEQPANKDWLVVAYNRESRVPLPEKEVLLRLCAHERIPDDNT